MDVVISVILSTYNETCLMVAKSVNSILQQSYSNIEIILINDNPAREDLHKLLSEFRERDERVVYVKNEQNIGLVKSLNKGIKLAKGRYIARMDADDISYKERFADQIEFLEKNNCDLIGCNIDIIDVEDNKIGEIELPTAHRNIKKYIKYGNCVLHPTWLVKKEVYEKLNGYREVYACEDYDFLLRAIIKGYKLGNASQNDLCYRVREGGISQRAGVKQRLIMYFLSKRMNSIEMVSVDDINSYLDSRKYDMDLKRIMDYESKKAKIKEKKNSFTDRIKYIVSIVFNKYFYINLIIYIKLKEREKCVDNISK